MDRGFQTAKISGNFGVQTWIRDENRSFSARFVVNGSKSCEIRRQGLPLPSPLYTNQVQWNELVKLWRFPPYCSLYLKIMRWTLYRTSSLNLNFCYFITFIQTYLSEVQKSFHFLTRLQRFLLFNFHHSSTFPHFYSNTPFINYYRHVLLQLVKVYEFHVNVDINDPRERSWIGDFYKSGYLHEVRLLRNFGVQTWIEDFKLQKSAGILQANVHQL